MPAFRLFVLICAVLLSGCSTVTLTPEFHSKTDLKTYQTYNFLPKQITQHQSLSTAKRIESIIDSRLSAHGFQRFTHQNPDFYITFHTQVRGKVNVEHFGYFYFHPDSLTATTQSEPYYKNAALIIDVIDAQNKELIWRGWEKGGEQEAIARYRIEETTSKILSKFLESSCEQDSSAATTVLTAL